MTRFLLGATILLLSVSSLSCGDAQKEPITGGGPGLKDSAESMLFANTDAHALIALSSLSEAPFFLMLTETATLAPRNKPKDCMKVSPPIGDPPNGLRFDIRFTCPARGNKSIGFRGSFSLKLQFWEDKQVSTSLAHFTPADIKFILIESKQTGVISLLRQSGKNFRITYLLDLTFTADESRSGLFALNHNLWLLGIKEPVSDESTILRNWTLTTEGMIQMSSTKSKELILSSPELSVSSEYEKITEKKGKHPHFSFTSFKLVATQQVDFDKCGVPKAKFNLTLNNKHKSQLLVDSKKIKNELSKNDVEWENCQKVSFPFFHNIGRALDKIDRVRKGKRARAQFKDF